MYRRSSIISDVNVAIFSGFTLVLMLLFYNLITPTIYDSTACICVLSTMCLASYLAERKRSKELTAIDFFIFITILLFILKPLYFLYVQDSILIRRLQHKYYYDYLLPYANKGIMLSSISVIFTLLGYHTCMRYSRKWKNAGSTPNVPKPAKEEIISAYFIHAITLLLFIVWVFLNGGGALIKKAVLSAADFRTGEIHTSYDHLKQFGYVFVASSLILFKHNIDTKKGYIMQGYLVAVGTLVSYFRNVSTSEVILYLLSISLIIYYSRGMNTRPFFKNIKFFFALVILVTIVPIILKTLLAAGRYFEFSYGVAALLESIFSSVKSTLDFYFSKFNSTEMMGFVLYLVGGSSNYFGVAYLILGVFSFLPYGLFGIDIEQTTVGVALTRLLTDSPGGNVTFPGLAYLTYGIASVIVLSILLGFFIAIATSTFYRRRNCFYINIVYVITISYFIIFFFRTGGPNYSFRRYFWMLFTFLFVKLLSRFQIGLFYRISRTPASKTG